MSNEAAPDQVPTQPAVVAITDRQLLVDVAQKLAGLVVTVKEGFEGSASRDLEIVQRVTQLETWRETAEARFNSNSLRASEPSKHDLEAAAALAEEIAKREALATAVATLTTKTDAQTVILGELRGAVVTWYSSPAGKVARYIAWGVALGWLAKNNIHIQGINP